MSNSLHASALAPDSPLSPHDLRRLGKVAVLMGGDSAERAVSLMSGDGVLQALQSEGVQAYAFDPAERPLSDLKAQGFARCFIALHGRRGEDGSLQGALEMLRIPYTGPGVMASAIAMDKVMSKRLWSTFGLPMPRQVVLDAAHQDASQTRLVPDELGLPLIVKPAREGSSIGVTKVEGYSQMAEAVRLAADHDGQVLCEEFIDGDEVTCALLGAGEAAHALPVIRIVPPANGSYDYQNKYFTDVTTYVVPNALPAAEEAEVQRVSLGAYRALGCRGWSRADLIVRRSDRRVFLLEMNTSPGMTGHSLVPMAAKAAGISYGQLCVHLVAQAALDD